MPETSGTEMTWINRVLIAVSAALIMFAIGRFVLKSWIFAAAGALIVVLILAVYFGRAGRPRSTK